MIFYGPDDPYTGHYDQEIIVTLSDWYHGQVSALLKSFVSVFNPTGAEPVPNSALMNDTTSLNITAKPGQTYLFRFINVGAFATQYVWFEGHDMRIVEVDGVWTNESQADLLYITPAQRYSVLVTMLNDTSKNYPLVSSMDTVRPTRLKTLLLSSS
jgi:iron transport multicopper oxidase